MVHKYRNLAFALPLIFSAASLKAESVSESDLALADQHIDTPVEVVKEQPQEAWVLADDYALENPVVAIALYAPENDPRTAQAQAVLEGWFAARNIPTKTFFGVSKTGIGASYYVKGLAFGPTVVNPKVALPKMQGAAEVYPDAWKEELTRKSEEKADQHREGEYIAALN